MLPCAAAALACMKSWPALSPKSRCDPLITICLLHKACILEEPNTAAAPFLEGHHAQTPRCQHESFVGLFGVKRPQSHCGCVLSHQDSLSSSQTHSLSVVRIPFASSQTHSLSPDAFDIHTCRTPPVKSEGLRGQPMPGRLRLMRYARRTAPSSSSCGLCSRTAGVAEALTTLLPQNLQN